MGHLWKRGKVWYMGYQDRRGKWKQESCRTTDKPTAKDRLKEKAKKCSPLFFAATLPLVQSRFPGLLIGLLIGFLIYYLFIARRRR